jgi:protein-tyrosine phosphatase
MTEHTRTIALRGTFNLRDVGGYSAGKSRTRWGALYRSDSLHRLDDSARTQLRGLGITLVIDLRDDEEREHSPSLLAGVAVEIVHNPVLQTPASIVIASDASLNDFYDEIVDNSGSRLVSALRYIARSGSGAVLVHCTAGKDRTGLVIALALALAGVDRDEIVRDYAATESHLPVKLLDDIILRLRAERTSGSVHLDELVRRSPAAVLERTFARIEGGYGSVAGYARAHGLADDDITSLRLALLESSDDDPAPQK